MPKPAKQRLRRACECCKKQFEVYRPQQRFCSGKCKQKDYRERLMAELRELRLGVTDKITNTAVEELFEGKEVNIVPLDLGL